MTSWFKVSATVLTSLAMVLMFALPLSAANNVIVVDNVENYQSQLAMRSSTNNNVEFSIGLDALGMQQKTLPEGVYQELSLPEGTTLVAGQAGDVGEPEMPVLTTLIAIPDQAGVTVTANYDSFEIIDNIDVMPVQPAMPEGGFDGPVEFAKNMTSYSQDEFLPRTLASAGEPMIMRDVRLAAITVYPVQYNPVTHQIKVYHNISVNVAYEGEVVNPKVQRKHYIAESFMELYRSYIANWDEFASTLTDVEVKRGSILIITPNVTGYDWVGDMRQIADWKRKKGYDVVLATTYDVDPSDGRPSQTQVKSYIQNAYNTWEEPPEFVYLVGDEDRIIPDYPYNGSYQIYTSDHPYSMLEGSDYLPDAAVCRVAVDNINELRSWMAKVVLYEIYPDVDNDPEYWRRAIMVAGGNQTVTCVWTVLWAKERLEQRGFVHVDTVFERNYYDPPDYYITNPITAGVGYVNYRGWAGASGWIDPSYNTSSLNQCQNINKPGIMTSIVCGTGDFGDSYSDPCFGETWLRMGTSTAPRGGPCFFGATDHSTHTRWNNPISFGFYDGLINKGLSHFGQAVIAGKLRQYECYPREHSTIQQYFHTYNMLGDPELEMRLQTPIVISVDHPDNIEAGINNMEVTVTDDNGAPVENAYVTLVMGGTADEAFFDVAKTDQFGYAILSVPTDTTGELDLTVSGRELKPYLATITLGQADQTIGLDTYTIDDDNSGFSHGNGDGNVNPSETIQLTLKLTNFGGSTTANNVVATLSPVDGSKAAVHHSQVQYGNIAPGQIVEGPNPFTFTAMPGLADGDDLDFLLSVVAEGVLEPWVSHVHIPVNAAKFSVISVQISDNNRLDPGETADMTITIENVGELDAQGLTGSLRTADGFIQVADANIDFGDIGMDESGSNSTPFSVTVHPATFEGKSVPFVLELTSQDGTEYSTVFNSVVGSLTASDPAGPDAYGYYVYDNTDLDYTEHPTYEWQSIRNLEGSTNLYLYDDTNDMVNLPFDFVYYGESHGRITVCSNGWICMDSSQWVGFRNFPLPDPSNARGMIAGFWDDLGPSGYDNVYTYYDTDNDKFIIEWSNVMARWNSYTRETFQIVLFDPAYYSTISGDGMIEFVYNNITNNHSGSGENYAAIGWEDYSEQVGFSISYSNYMTAGCANLTSGRVYRITTNNGFGGISGNVTVQIGTPEDVRIDFSSGQWGAVGGEGTYAIKDIPPGTVDVTFSKDGWFPVTVPDIEVAADLFTRNVNADLQLCPIPTNLEASENLGDHVNLTWNTVNHADVAGYDVYRSNWENGVFTKLNDALVTDPSYDDYTTVGNRMYSYYVVAVFQGSDYEAVSLSSNKVYGSNAEITDIDDPDNVPARFDLSQNYPNPFNIHTVINFALPSAGHVTLDVFNVLGQRVKTLYQGYHDAGYLSVVWDGSDESGETVASGLYFYRLATDNEQITKRMTLLK